MDLTEPIVHHLSYQNKVSLPVLMTFLRPLSRSAFATLQATQVREQEPLVVHGEGIAWLERYLAFRTLTQGELSPAEIFQSSLARREVSWTGSMYTKNPHDQ